MQERLYSPIQMTQDRKCEKYVKTKNFINTKFVYGNLEIYILDTKDPEIEQI
jgi:hypothetical protein